MYLNFVMRDKRATELAVSRARPIALFRWVRETEFTTNFTGIMDSNRESNVHSGFK